MQLGSPFVVEIVALGRHDRLHRLQVHHTAFGQVGGLVEHETTVVNTRFERLNHFQNSTPPRSRRRAGPSAWAAPLRASAERIAHGAARLPRLSSKERNGTE